MILSYRHKFIFLHTRKTAGSSITAAINRFIGPSDVQVGAWPDTIVAGGDYNDNARKIVRRAFPIGSGKAIRRALALKRPIYDPKLVNDLIQKHYIGLGLMGGAHSTARDVRGFDQKLWSESFKFCFVRNPWTHAVSDYHWRCSRRGHTDVPFKEFLLRIRDPGRPDPERVRPPLRSNWSIFTIDDKVVVDYVARYEDITTELKKISKIIGINVDIRDVFAKGNIRSKHKPVQSYYDDEDVEIVRDIYRNEIELFDYRPFA